jgi:hypothetical protein
VGRSPQEPPPSWDDSAAYEAPPSWFRRHRWDVILGVLFVVVVGSLLTYGLLMGNEPKSGSAIFSDDFSEPSDRWPSGSSDAGLISFTSGAYQVVALPQASMLALTDVGGSQGDVRVEVTVVQMPDQGSTFVGVACRAAARQRLYELGITPGGQWAIVRRPDRDVLASGQFDTSLLGSGPVGLRADCVGGTATPEPGESRTISLTLSVNGESVGVAHDSQDAQITSGGYGMTVENGGDRVTVRFDDFRVTAP